jgi:GTPase SAR1 family protein
MQISHSPTKILVSGNSGSGKSTFATAYLLNSRHTYKFLFDQEGECQERLGFAAAYDADGLTEQLEQGWVIFDPSEMFPEDLDQGLEFFCQWVFSVKRAINDEDKDAGRPFSTALFFTDELQNLVETHSVPRGLRKILEQGRRQGIDSLIVTQQPNIIHNRTRNQITEIVAFSQVDENAVKFLEDQRFDGDQVRSLEVGHWQLLQPRSQVFQWGHVNFKPPRVIVDGTKVLRPRADTSDASLSTAD